MEIIFFTIAVITFLLGPVFASYFSVQVMRGEKLTKAVGSRSMCDNCGHTLSWYELIPILSFLLQRGHCRKCGGKLDVKMFLAELTGLILFGFLGLSFLPLDSANLAQSGLYVFIQFITVFLLLYLSIFDLFTFTIPGPVVTYTLLWVFAVNIILIVLKLLHVETFVNIGLGGFDNLLMAAIAAFLLWVIVYVSKEKAMGMGDVYLAAIVGAGLGWPATVTAFYGMIFSAAGVGLVMAAIKKKFRGLRVPLVPFIAFGYVLGLAYGESIFEMLFLLV